MMKRSTNPWIVAIAFALFISTLSGHYFQARAQINESQEFFDEGEQEFEQEAETLEEPQSSESTPLLTVDEEPAGGEVNPPAGSSGEVNPLPTTDATEDID